jgi:hypothetical protein
MYKWVHRFAWAALLAMLCHNFFFWGGLALTPGIGLRLDLQSQRSPSDVGVAFYAQSGRDMMSYIAPGAAREYARSAIGPERLLEIAASPTTVPQQLRDAMPWLPALTYYGAPVMLLVALILYWLRPKTIKVFGS